MKWRWSRCFGGLMVLGLTLVVSEGQGQGRPAAQTGGEVRRPEPVSGLISGKRYTTQHYEMYRTGKPFKLVARTTRVVTLPDDGETRTTVTEEHAFRDSAGRFRLESGPLQDGVMQVRRVLIFDPVALTQVVYRPGDPVARVTGVEPRQVPTAEEEASAEAQKERSAAYRREHPGSGSEEQLGQRVMVGEATTGERRVAVFPANGGQAGFETVTEAWTAPELGVALLLKEQDGRGTVMTREVTELKQEEPEASLFQVPAGMRMEAGSGLAGGVRTSRPMVISQAAPEFSEEARRKKISGNVMVSLVVDEKGMPTEIRVVRGVGYGLDEKAIEAVSRYKFKPAMRDGVAIRSSINVDVNFQTF